jgi:hypothetical protein
LLAIDLSLLVGLAAALEQSGVRPLRVLSVVVALEEVARHHGEDSSAQLDGEAQEWRVCGVALGAEEISMYGINSIGGTYMFSRSRLVGLEFGGAILGNGGRWVVRVVVVVWKIVRVLARSVSTPPE